MGRMFLSFVSCFKYYINYWSQITSSPGFAPVTIPYCCCFWLVLCLSWTNSVNSVFFVMFGSWSLLSLVGKLMIGQIFFLMPWTNKFSSFYQVHACIFVQSCHWCISGQFTTAFTFISGMNWVSRSARDESLGPSQDMHTSLHMHMDF